MDFAFARDTTKYERMMSTIHSYRKATTLVNPVGIHSIKYPLFSPARQADLVQTRHTLLLMQPIFKLYNNWYGR